MKKSSGLLDSDLDRPVITMPVFPIDDDPLPKCGPKLSPAPKTIRNDETINNPVKNSQSGFVLIPVDLVDPSPFQPRIAFDVDRIEALAENIKEVGGILQPITVRKNGDRFELIAGERRLQAYKLVGLNEIPAIIQDYSDAEAFKMCATENLQREDLAAFEIAKLLRKLKTNNVCKNNSELSRVTGIARPNVVNYLHFFDLPDESLQILEFSPNLIGQGVAAVLAKQVNDGHGDIVTEVIRRVRDNKTLSSKAEKWVLDQVQGNQNPLHSKRDFVNHKGNRIASITRTDKRLSVSVTDEENLLEIEELINSFFSEISNQERSTNKE
jgi:ParB family chromosome partitioning protein